MQIYVSKMKAVIKIKSVHCSATKTINHTIWQHHAESSDIIMMWSFVLNVPGTVRIPSNVFPYITDRRKIYRSLPRWHFFLAKKPQITWHPPLTGITTTNAKQRNIPTKNHHAISIQFIEIWRFQFVFVVFSEQMEVSQVRIKDSTSWTGDGENAGTLLLRQVRVATQDAGVINEMQTPRQQLRNIVLYPIDNRLPGE